MFVRSYSKLIALRVAFGQQAPAGGLPIAQILSDLNEDFESPVAVGISYAEYTARLHAPPLTSRSYVERRSAAPDKNVAVRFPFLSHQRIHEESMTREYLTFSRADLYELV